MAVAFFIEKDLNPGNGVSSSLSLSFRSPIKNVKNKRDQKTEKWFFEMGKNKLIFGGSSGNFKSKEKHFT